MFHGTGRRNVPSSAGVPYGETDGVSHAEHQGLPHDTSVVLCGRVRDSCSRSTSILRFVLTGLVVVDINSCLLIENGNINSRNYQPNLAELSDSCFCAQLSPEKCFKSDFSVCFPKRLRGHIVSPYGFKVYIF